MSPATDSPNLALLDAPIPAIALPVDRSVSLLPVEVMVPVLAEYTERRTTFRDWLRARMVQGIHFGYPPGVNRGDERSLQYASRPSLYKAGAQLCCDLLKMRPEWAADESAWRMLGSEPGVFVFACRLINLGGPFFADRPNGETLGEGRGVFKVGEKKMQENAAIKMAEKRALIDAVINTLAIADLFTQDIEPPEPGEAPEHRADAPKVAPRAERQQAKAPPLPADVVEAMRPAVEAFKFLHGEEDYKARFTAYAQTVLKTEGRIAWTVEAAKAVNAALQLEADNA